MIKYIDKSRLITEINKTSTLFIEEFKDIQEKDKDLLIEGIDKTPAQMIMYQLGWMNLLLSWESQEKDGIYVITPTSDYKWNKLGELYNDFYKSYSHYSLEYLIAEFIILKDKIITLVNSYSHDELFLENMRQWASSTPSNWPVWKWIHINTVAPFKSFRAKIRKFKKLKKLL